MPDGSYSGQDSFADDFAVVLRGTALLVQSVTPDGRLRYVNEAWKATLGYGDADIAGLSFLDVIVPEEREHCSLLFRRLLDGEEDGVVETVFLTRTGERVDVIGDVRLRRDAQGAVLATGGIFRDVREEHRQRRFAATRELRTGTLLAALTEGIVIVNASGTVEQVNDAAERILGTSRASMIGHALLALPWVAHEADGRVLDRSTHPIMAALHEGRPQPERLLRYPRRDGSEVWIATAAHPLRRPDGRIEGAVSSFRDVTAQKAAEEALRSSETQYRSLFERNGTVQLLVDAETGLIQAANPAAEAFYELSNDALVGRHVSSLSRLDPSSVAPMSAMIESGTLSVFQRRQYRAGGEARDVEIYGSPVSSGGRLLLHVIVIDVTARIAAEIGQRRLAAVLDQTPDVVGMFDLEGRLFYANRAGRQLMGLPPLPDGGGGDAMHDIPPDAIGAGHPGTDADRVLREATAAAAVTGSWHGETMLNAPDGAPRVMSQVVLAHRDPGGALTHFSTILHDVSEARRTELLLLDQAHELEAQTEELRQQTDELLAARDAAESANSAKSQFLAHMSHELRTPLTAIIGFARILASNRQNSLSAQEVVFADRVLHNAVRLLELINQLLDLSKVEAGHVKLELSDVDVSALAVDVVADLDGRERAAGVELRADIPASPAIIRADVTKLRQVLVNLVGNALKFTTEGRVVVTVRTSGSGVAESLAVTDTGIGIAPAHQASVFEPFAQEDTSITRRFGGTGLGLAISKEYCELMAFSLEVESVPGRGSTFSVVFRPTSPSAPSDSGRSGAARAR